MSNHSHLVHIVMNWPIPRGNWQLLRGPRLAVLAFAGALGLALAGCTGSQTQDPADVRQAGGSDGASTTGATQGSRFSGDPLDDPSSPLHKRIIYFEFNSADVLPDGRETAGAHARYLAANPDVRIRLEGHADERGTREYNIALGDFRGRSVRQLMGVLGASQNQLDLVSYGEERPADPGHSESAWSLNRRVEIVYINRG
ncbi:MAG: peptidoglycan-associated lipoprotein [Gammaproteobacteria bacterium]